ncbi:hypothetical protein C1I92_14760 [Jiangella anatolica]|uniref:Beta-lactamase-related domain-containing protein n=1 Tax=Jiangella anatolica TaxID=2670374 RepID=A0A2W2CAV1_9ACTN|nr:hypothetical protein C1I92_14760 [Jiangella anatolica]
MAVMLVLAACTSEVDSPSGSSASSAPPGCDPGLAAWAEAGFSGSMAVVERGEPVCSAGYGLADRAGERSNAADTVFAIGSVTKAFTAAAILDLADSGALTTDDRVGELLPSLRGPVADATLMQLMTHTSGLSGGAGPDHRPLSEEDALAAISALPLMFASGTGYEYSNAAYTLLALVVEELGGGYRSHAASRILAGLPSAGFWDGEPAASGPRAVGYLEDGSAGEPGDFGGPHWALDGNGGLAMSMPDLAAWTHALFTGEVVSPSSAQVLASPVVELGEGQAETPGWVAVDASAYGEPFLAAAGGGGDVGHDAMVVWVPAAERAIAVASNGGAVSAEELLAAVGPALATGGPIPPPEAPGGAVDPDAAAAIVGDYRLDTGGTFQVTYDDGELRVAGLGADAVAALFPPDDAAAVAEHERQVAALLGDDLVALAGTVLADGELRTYVTADTGEGPLLVWYALDAKGVVAAVEEGTDPPALTLATDGDGFAPVDPTGTGPDVRLTFDADAVTVTGPDGAVPAERS